MLRNLILQLLGLLSAGVASAAPQALHRPHSPVPAEQSLSLFQLDPGLQIELVAAEPDVIDPVAIRFDERGHLWVVEMRDYPHGPPEGSPPLSRIRVLEDRDGDGRYETPRVFADELLFVTGVQPWQGGAFVTMAGQVAYLKDTTGDGRADQIQTWFTGFAEENPQLRANHPRLRWDGQIYVANGLRGGQIQRVVGEPSEQPLSISGLDFAFDPHTGSYQAVTGAGQFGLTLDRFHQRFVCSNRNPLVHIVLEDRYLKRSPQVAVAKAVQDVARAGDQSRVFPLVDAWTTSTLHAGQFTAACGVFIYQDGILPAEYHGNAFTCEPTGSLVHREIIQPDGASFVAQGAAEGREFLASRDSWFRPVNSETGPDGALYVVDMYRAVIEHPQFMPDELKQRPDLREGDDRGRIYRITRAKADDQGWIDLGDASSDELVALLEHDHSWTRETAFRLLLERRDDSCCARLTRIVRQSTQAPARAAALWLLWHLGGLEEDLLRAALEDRHPRVREQALLIAERIAPDLAGLRPAVAARAADPDPRVRFQVALSLTPVRATEIEILEQVARRGAADSWTREAVALAAGPHAARLLAALLPTGQVSPSKEGGDDDPSRLLLAQRLAQVAGRSEDYDALRLVLERLVARAPQSELLLQFTVWRGLLETRRTTTAAFLDKLDAAALQPRVAEVLERAADVATDAQQTLELRVAATELLSFDERFAPTLIELTQPEAEQPVRLAAIAALSRNSLDEHWPPLIERFSRESPAVRRAILDALLSRSQRVGLLLQAIESNTIRATELDLALRQRLMKHPDADIRQRATRLLAEAIPEDRQVVLNRYRDVLKMHGDPVQGRAIFTKNCANCHRIGDVGINVAPDIGDSRTKTPEQLLTDILQPNQAIDNNYISYTVTTTDGRVLTGVLASETSSSITLLQVEGKQESLLRSEIDQLHSNGVSLMPVGLEKGIPPQQMADLISFIKNWRYLKEQVSEKQE